MAWHALRAAPNTGVMGTVYLLHLVPAPDGTMVGHARHYTGWAPPGRLEGRLEDHRNGTGSKLLAEARRRGVTFELVQTWEGDRNFERLLKNRGGAGRHCPVCRGELLIASPGVLVPAARPIAA